MWHCGLINRKQEKQTAWEAQAKGYSVSTDKAPRGAELGEP